VFEAIHAGQPGSADESRISYVQALPQIAQGA